jgi:hypothetical protein
MNTRTLSPKTTSRKAKALTLEEVARRRAKPLPRSTIRIVDFSDRPVSPELLAELLAFVNRVDSMCFGGAFRSTPIPVAISNSEGTTVINGTIMVGRCYLAADNDAACETIQKAIEARKAIVRGMCLIAAEKAGEKAYGPTWERIANRVARALGLRRARAYTRDAMSWPFEAPKARTA